MASSDDGSALLGQGEAAGPGVGGSAGVVCSVLV